MLPFDLARSLARLHPPFPTYLDRLRERGVELPPASDLADGPLSRKLWQALEALAEIRVLIRGTDHLSDRELFTVLRDDLLAGQSVPAKPDQIDYMDLSLGTTPEAIDIFLRYYADRTTRREIARRCPGLKLPQRENLPFDRDRRLPVPGATPPRRTGRRARRSSKKQRRRARRAKSRDAS